MSRRSYEDSVRRLEKLGYIEVGQVLRVVPQRRPRFDDDVLGIQFFRTRVEHEDLSDLTLPGAYFGRSEIVECSFRNTDLRLSTMCWNDFVDVDFSGACLSDCDMRASSFTACNFDGADLRGTLLAHSCGLELRAPQRESIVWSDEEPHGG